MLQLFIPLAAIAAVFYGLAQFSDQEIEKNSSKIYQEIGAVLPEQVNNSVSAPDVEPKNNSSDKNSTLLDKQAVLQASLTTADPSVNEVLNTDQFPIVNASVLDEPVYSSSQKNSQQGNGFNDTDLAALNRDTAQRLSANKTRYRSKYKDKYKVEDILALNRNTSSRMQAIDTLLGR